MVLNKIIEIYFKKKLSDKINIPKKRTDKMSDN